MTFDTSVSLGNLLTIVSIVITGLLIRSKDMERIATIETALKDIQESLHSVHEDQQRIASLEARVTNAEGELKGTRQHVHDLRNLIVRDLGKQ